MDKESSCVLAFYRVFEHQFDNREQPLYVKDFGNDFAIKHCQYLIYVMQREMVFWWLGVNVYPV